MDQSEIFLGSTFLGLANEVDLPKVDTIEILNREFNDLMMLRLRGEISIEDAQIKIDNIYDRKEKLEAWPYIWDKNFDMVEYLKKRQYPKSNSLVILENSESGLWEPSKQFKGRGVKQLIGFYQGSFEWRPRHRPKTNKGKILRIIKPNKEYLRY